MDLEGIRLIKKKQRKKNMYDKHLYVKSKIYNKLLHIL